MRLIDADVLKKLRHDYIQGRIKFDGNEYDLIDKCPTIEAEPVRHGRWVWFENWLESTPVNPRECLDCGWQCSECKNALEDMVGGYWDNPDEVPALKHCPECGAIMDGGGER